MINALSWPVTLMCFYSEVFIINWRPNIPMHKTCCKIGTFERNPARCAESPKMTKFQQNSIVSPRTLSFTYLPGANCLLTYSHQSTFWRSMFRFFWKNNKQHASVYLLNSQQTTFPEICTNFMTHCVAGSIVVASEMLKIAKKSGANWQNWHAETAKNCAKFLRDNHKQETWHKIQSKYYVLQKVLQKKTVTIWRKCKINNSQKVKSFVCDIINKMSK